MAEATLKTGWTAWRFDQMAVEVKDRIDDPRQADHDRYVGLEHLDSGSLKIWRWGSTQDVEKTKLLFKSGDIIFGRRNAYLRRVAVADFDGVCSAHAMVLRARPEVALPEFLPFFMQTDGFWEAALRNSAGSLSPTINWSNIAKEKFTLPPLEEQQRIASVLSQCQRVQSAHHILQRQADRLAAALFSHRVFGGKLPRGAVTEIRLPSDWTWRELGEVVLHTKAGLFKRKDDYGSGSNIVGVSDLYDHRSIHGQTFALAPATDKEISEYSLEEGDLLYGESSLVRAGIARTLPVTSGGAGTLFAWHTRRLKVDRSQVSPFFLSAYLNSPLGRREIQSRATTTVLTGMTVADFLAIPIPCGPLKVQRRIHSELEAIWRAQQGSAARDLSFERVRGRIMDASLGAEA